MKTPIGSVLFTVVWFGTLQACSVAPLSPQRARSKMKRIPNDKLNRSSCKEQNGAVMINY